MNITIKRDTILILMQLLPLAKGTGKQLKLLNYVTSKCRKLIPYTDEELQGKTIADIASVLSDNYAVNISGTEFDAVESFLKAKYNEVISNNEFSAINAVAENLNIDLDSEIEDVSNAE